MAAALARAGDLVEATASEADALSLMAERAVERGDAEAYGEAAVALRRALREGLAMWGEAGDHLREAAEALVHVLAKAAPDARIYLLAAAGRLREELGWQTLPPLERLLADQLVLAWLSAEVVGWCHRVVSFRGTGEDGRGLAWERRLKVAERRVQDAASALARVGREVRATKATRGAYATAQPPPDAVADPLAVWREDPEAAPEEVVVPDEPRPSVWPPPTRLTYDEVLAGGYNVFDYLFDEDGTGVYCGDANDGGGDGEPDGAPGDGSITRHA